MNILFTCAGRRNYLINYFKEALPKGGKIFAADYQRSAPALVEADIALKVPRIYDKDYIHSLIRIIKKYQIKALIPLNDLELPILSKNKRILESAGAQIIVSDQNVIEIAFDKWKTFTFFKSIDIKTPQTFLDLKSVSKALKSKIIQYPLIVKPRWGSASIGIDVARDKEELLLSYKLQLIKIKKSILKDASAEDLEKSVLIQEKINGDEYGIDILNDFNGNHYGSFARKKLSMRSGETDKAISVISEKFTRIAKKIGKHIRHIGNMDCDFFIYRNEVYFLEMNPRFGGGYPFSHEAGINIPAIYTEWLSGKSEVDMYNNFKSNKAFAKCDRILKIPRSTI